MLLRFGAVIWWLGAASFVLMLLSAGYRLQTSWNCPKTLAEYAKEDARVAELHAESRRKDPEWEFASRGSKKLDELQPAYRACNGGDSAYWISAAAGLAALVLLAIAFVLGGSFWTPPRLRSLK